MVGFQRGQENSRQFANVGGLAEVGLHKVFNPASAAVVGIAHRICHFDLHVEGQLICWTSCNQMNMAAHGPKEILGVDEGFEFFGRKHAQIDQFGGVLDAMHIFADPEERLQIAQPAFAFFHVRFNHIALAALLAVPCCAFFQFCFDKVTGR